VRVIVTRPREQAAALVERLEALGHEVELCPLIAIEPTGPEEIDLSGYDWVVVTSAMGARLLRERMQGRPAHIAAIGRATAAAWGEPVDLVPAVATQEGLLAELPRPAGAVLFAGAEGARRKLADALDAVFVPLYRTVERRPDGALDGDLVVLASPSAARSLAALHAQLPAVSIGSETTREAARSGVHVLEEAASPALDDLVAAVLRASR
jgi:uroporphyrinogen-III synthase